MEEIVLKSVVKNAVREAFNATLKELLSEQDFKNKVKNLLLKWGNNSADVDKMIAKEFDYAYKKYSTPEKVADVIRTLY